MAPPLCSRLIHQVDQPQPRRTNVSNAQTIAEACVLEKHHLHTPHTASGWNTSDISQQLLKRTLPVKGNNLYEAVVVANHAVTRDRRLSGRNRTNLVTYIFTSYFICTQTICQTYESFFSHINLQFNKFPLQMFIRFSRFYAINFRYVL